MKTKASFLKGGGGFSLVELLVTISVIAILASVAVPNILNMGDGAREAKDQRNAQTIANIASSALAAGYPPENIATRETLLARLKEGITVRNGNISVDFSLSGMADADIDGAGDFLEVSQGKIQLLAERAPEIGDDSGLQHRGPPSS